MKIAVRYSHQSSSCYLVVRISISYFLELFNTEYLEPFLTALQPTGCIAYVQVETEPLLLVCERVVLAHETKMTDLLSVLLVRR